MTPTPIDWRISLARIEKHLAELCLFLRDYLRANSIDPEESTDSEVVTPSGVIESRMSTQSKKEAIKSLIRNRELSKKAWKHLKRIQETYRLVSIFAAVDKAAQLEDPHTGFTSFDEIWQIEQEGGR